MIELDKAGRTLLLTCSMIASVTGVHVSTFVYGVALGLTLTRVVLPAPRKPVINVTGTACTWVGGAVAAAAAAAPAPPAPDANSTGCAAGPEPPAGAAAGAAARGTASGTSSSSELLIALLWRYQRNEADPATLNSQIRRAELTFLPRGRTCCRGGAGPMVLPPLWLAAAFSSHAHVSDVRAVYCTTHFLVLLLPGTMHVGPFFIEQAGRRLAAAGHCVRSNSEPWVWGSETVDEVPSVTCESSHCQEASYHTLACAGAPQRRLCAVLQAQHACSMEPCSYSIRPKTTEMAAITAAVLLAVSPPFAGTAPARVAAAFPALLESTKVIERP